MGRSYLITTIPNCDFITMNVSINAVTNSAKLREAEREREKINLMRTF